MSDDTPSEMQGSGDDELEALLADVSLADFTPEIQEDVDILLSSGQALEPDVRIRFIDAARRGTREWALREHAALERLLFESRRARADDPDAIAAIIGIDVELMRSVERGETRIAEQPAAVVASWAIAVDIDRGALVNALRRSLSRRGATPAYAGDRQLRLEPEDEQFVQHVLSAFDERMERDT